MQKQKTNHQRKSLIEEMSISVESVASGVFIVIDFIAFIYFFKYFKEKNAKYLNRGFQIQTQNHQNHIV